MPDYVVSFSAMSGEALAPDAADRLAATLAATPGTGPVDGATQDPESRRVSASFVIAVPERGGMADAARDGSRLAKEALNNAGMPDAHLVRLAIRLEEEREDHGP